MRVRALKGAGERMITQTEKVNRPARAAGLILILGLFYHTLWNLYDHEKSSYLVFAGAAATLVLFAGMLIRSWRGLSYWGISFSGWKPALKESGLVFLAVLVGCAIYMKISGHDWMHVKWTRILEFPLAGLLQHFIFQSFFYNQYESLTRNRVLSIFLAAATFGFFHLPNPALVLITGMTGLYASYLFAKYRNLFVVALMHGWISLALTVTLEPAGVIRDYKVGPQPMGPIIEIIETHLEPESNIAQYLPNRGISSNFEEAFDRPVEEMTVPWMIDRLIDSPELSFAVIGKEQYEALLPQLRLKAYIWKESRVWLRKFPKRRSRTLKCVLTLNFRQLDRYYREDILLIANRPPPEALKPKG